MPANEDDNEPKMLRINRETGFRLRLDMVHHKLVKNLTHYNPIDAGAMLKTMNL